MRNVTFIAADLDPHGVLQRDLSARAEKLNITFQFIQGDITSRQTRERFMEHAPYDISLYIGLSSWLPKSGTVKHLIWLREHMRSDAVLVTDCFTADAYSLSGHYVGYKAHYYEPQVYSAVMDFCGFDGPAADVESGRDCINHVLVLKQRKLLQERHGA